MAELTTERLILRPVVRGDMRQFMALASVRDVAEMTLDLPHPLSKADGEGWLVASQRDDDRVFAIVRSDDKTFLGSITLTVSESGQSAQTTFWLGRAHWGHGYATEAVRRVMLLAFGQMKLGSVKAEVLAGNEAAMRVLEKTGFREEGTAMRSLPARGKDEREVVLFTATRASFAQTVLSQAVGRQ